MIKKFTTAEIYTMQADLKKFIDKDIKLSARTAWNIDVNYETLSKIVNQYGQHRDKLLQPLAEKGAFEQLENGNTKVKKEFIPEFQKVTKELDEYLELEHEVEIKPISHANLPDELSVQDIKALRFMVADDE